MNILSYIIGFFVTALFTGLIMCLGRNRIRFDENAIVIRIAFIPLRINNNKIKSIRLVDELPKVLFGVHGQGFRIGNRCRGSFLVNKMTDGVNKKMAVQLFLDNAKKSRRFIEIETVDGFVFINLKNDEQTENLFEEMTKTVRIVGEYELAESSARKIRIIALSIGLVAAIALVIYYILEK